MTFTRIASALVLATTPACMSVVKVAPAEYVPANKPDHIVILDDIGALHVIEGPSMVGDNLVGFEAGEEASFPISQVTGAVVKVKSPSKTRFLIAGLTVATGAAIYGVTQTGSAANCQIVDNAGVPQGKSSRAGDWGTPAGCFPGQQE